MSEDNNNIESKDYILSTLNSDKVNDLTPIPGFLYLLQPAEFINTDTYKIGMTKNNNLDRCRNGYSSESDIIQINKCYFPRTAESDLKKIFKEKYTLTQGYEYFSGEIDDMIVDFNEIINEYRKLYKIILKKQIEQIKEEKQVQINNEPVKRKIKDKKQKQEINKLDQQSKQITEYTCKRCYYTTNKKCNYDKHLNRKVQCDPKFYCESCKKILANKYTLQRHNNKLHPELDTTPEPTIYELQQQLIDLRTKHTNLENLIQTQ